MTEYRLPIVFGSTFVTWLQLTHRVFFVVAPIKALCSERHEDWSMKFQSLGLSCQELTGDSDVDDFWQLQKADIILTTPVNFFYLVKMYKLQYVCFISKFSQPVEVYFRVAY